MSDKNNKKELIEKIYLNEEEEEEEEEDEEEDEDEDEYYNSYDKWRYSIYSALVFLIISCPYTYLLVNKLLGKYIKISSLNGCPTIVGIFVHSLVFALIIRGMMELNI
jgi:Na+/glutamate symporter